MKIRRKLSYIFFIMSLLIVGMVGCGTKEEAMKDNEIFNNFTIGIVDDVTNLSIRKEPITISNNVKQFLIYGYGSDGMVGASKDLIKIVGDNTSAFVQGYFQYDSKKRISKVTLSNGSVYDFSYDIVYKINNPSQAVVNMF